MVREARRLSEAFVENHPGEAAQVLEALASAETAAYLAELPVKVAAAVVKRMAPPYSARCAENLDEKTLMALAEVLGPQPVAALLQHLPVERQARVLHRLPVGVAVAVRLLIGYPRDTAGAWMDPWPLAVPGETAVADVIEQLRRFEGSPDDVVFIVEGEWRLRGVVTAAVLLRSAPRESIGRIMREPAPVVSALAPVTTLREHASWLELPALPVIERGERLVGALTRRSLEAALAEVQSTPATRVAGETLGALGGAYWQSLTALTQLTVTLLPGIGRVDRKEDGNER